MVPLTRFVYLKDFSKALEILALADGAAPKPKVGFGSRSWRSQALMQHFETQLPIKKLCRTQ